MTITVTGIQDRDSDIIATTLLNVCVMEARRRGRPMLTTRDFTAFKTMLSAVESLGAIDAVNPGQQIEQAQQERPAAIQSGVEAVAQAIGQGTTMPPPNVMT